MSKINSTIRNIAIKLSKVIFKNEALRKRLVVLFYNFQVLFYKKNQKAGLFEYNKIIKNKKFFCQELYRGNFLYGTSNNLRKYANYMRPIRACIEHGIYFGDYINKEEVHNSGYSTVITFGNSRKEIILKYNPNKNVICIGPYIYYAEPVLNEQEMLEIKEKNGKTLLVFPSHSISGVNANYNVESLISQINNFKNEHKFKTVLICLYYKDIENNVDEAYINAGFQVVSAGRREDPDFLSRLKSYILISDYVASNNVGTHIGYTVLLKRPHIIFHQKIKYDVADATNKKHIENMYDNLAIDQKKEICEAFKKYTPYITKKQLEVCNKYWGFSYIKDKSSLASILIDLK